MIALTTEKSMSGARMMIAASLLMLSSCTGLELAVDTTKRVTQPSPPLEGKPTYKVGSPYQIAGQWYYPKVDYGYDESGVASWYGPNFEGEPTANGEIFLMDKISAAHRTLPLPSVVRVTNLENGRSLVVRVNDRGPFARGRIIDMSKRAAELLGFADKGTAMVRVQILAVESQRVAVDAGAVGQKDFGAPPPPAVPTVEVTVETLQPGIGGGQAAPATQLVSAGGGYAGPPVPYNGTTAISGDGRTAGAEVAPAASAGATAVPVAQDEVTVVPVVGRPQIYIQAGAFTQYVNADRVRARLSILGAPVQITQVYVTGQPFFRVRMGPLNSVPEADQALERVMQAGVEEAQIVVD